MGRNLLGLSRVYYVEVMMMIRRAGALLLLLLTLTHAGRAEGRAASIEAILGDYAARGYAVVAMDADLDAGRPDDVGACILRNGEENLLLLMYRMRPGDADGGFHTALASTLALPQGAGIGFRVWCNRWDNMTGQAYGAEAIVVEIEPPGDVAYDLVLYRNPGASLGAYEVHGIAERTDLGEGLARVRSFETNQGGTPMGLRESVQDGQGQVVGMSLTAKTSLVAERTVDTLYFDGLMAAMEAAALTDVLHKLPLYGSWPSDIGRGQMLPVYSGPGTGYYRASEGKAAVSTNESFGVLGVEGDWALIRYSVGDRDRYGYIEASALPAGFEAMALTFDYREVKLVRDCQLMDGPHYNNKRLNHLQVADKGTLTVLCETESYDEYYVEYRREGKPPVRGFLNARYFEM